MKRPLFSNIRGRTPTNGRYRSKLEREGLVHWLVRHDVESAQLNELRITYTDSNGKSKKYLADLVVRWRMGVDRRPLAIEYKYRSELAADPTLQQKHALLKPAFWAKGYEFRVYTDADVFTADYGSKEFIVGFRSNSASPYDEEIVAFVRSAGCVTLERLLAGLRHTERERLGLVPQVWRLVATARLFVGYGPQPLGDATFLHATPLPLPEP